MAQAKVGMLPVSTSLLDFFPSFSFPAQVPLGNNYLTGRWHMNPHLKVLFQRTWTKSNGVMNKCLPVFFEIMDLIFLMF